MHVNNAWSQIDSSSHSSPSTHWLPSLQAGAALFPSSDWLCLEGTEGDGKSPAPFSHAVLAALAPHCSDLCVCCWHSTLEPLVNFSWGCGGPELSFGYLLLLQTFLKGKSTALLRSRDSFYFLPPPFFSLPDRAGAVIGSNAVSQFCHNNSCCFCFFLDVSRSGPPPHSTYPLSSYSLSFFFLFLFPLFVFLLLFFHTLTYGAGVGSNRHILNDPALRTERALSVLSPRGLCGKSAEAGHPVQPPME